MFVQIFLGPLQKKGDIFMDFLSVFVPESAPYSDLTSSDLHKHLYCHPSTPTFLIVSHLFPSLPLFCKKNLLITEKSSLRSSTPPPAAQCTLSDVYQVLHLWMMQWCSEAVIHLFKCFANFMMPLLHWSTEIFGCWNLHKRPQLKCMTFFHFYTCCTYMASPVWLLSCFLWFALLVYSYFAGQM